MTHPAAPFALPLRRVGEASILDAHGLTVLVVDPERAIDTDRPVAAIADYVFAMLAAAPAAPQAAGVGERDYPAEFEAWWATYRHRNRDVADYSVKKQIAFDAFYYAALRAPSREPEGGAVDGWRTIDSAPIGELVQVYWPCMALDDDGEPTGETLDREGHVSLSVRHSEQHGWEPDNVVEANGDWFGDDFEFGQPTHWRPRPSRPAAAIATREEAPAEAGEEP